MIFVESDSICQSVCRIHFTGKASRILYLSQLRGNDIKVENGASVRADSPVHSS